ncbi:MAG: PKD domain-containing protein [Planctomycetota bacterium]
MPLTQQSKPLRMTLLLALAALAGAAVHAWLGAGPPPTPSRKGRGDTIAGQAVSRTLPNCGTARLSQDLPQRSTAPGANNAGPDVQAPSKRRDADYWPQEPHPIALRRRTLLPGREAAVSRADEKLVWLVQFGGPLGPDGMAELLARGVEILLPTVAGAFHARASQRELCAASLDFAPRILGWCRLRPEDKLLPAAAAGAGGWPKEAIDGAGQLRQCVELYPGTDVHKAVAAIQAQGGAVRGQNAPHQRPDGGWSIEVSCPADRDSVLRLAALEDVYALDLPRPPKRAHNEEAASASNITILQAAPYSLTGAGITVMVRDEGKVFAHPDLSGRLLFAPAVAALATTSQHSTHVSGTIAGTGLLNPAALARGMAIGCTLVSFDLSGDDVNDVLQASQNNGVVISNHSYGFATGWDAGTFTDNQNTFGVYSTLAQEWDGIILSGALVLVKSIGNSRNQSGPGFPPNGALAPDGDYYGTTDASSTGKNILAVSGAAAAARAGVPNTGTVVLPSSSSGPCLDGRLRPELIADGDTVTSCNNSVTPGQEYVALTGSSMACAVVTGATVLFIQNYQTRFGSGAYPPPHYLRAIYAQTATDQGRPGPDYLHGFGMLDLAAAVSLFQIDNPASVRIVNAGVDGTVPERFYVLNSDGVTAIKATLCWTDQPGDVLAAKALVNDLDLRLIRVSDQAVFFPFTLDPAHPEQPAKSAVNSVDTIEQVVLSAPAAGSYLLAVRGATLATAAGFTLASSHGLVEDPAPVPVINANATTGPPPFQVTFDGSASHAPSGSIVSYSWDFGDGTAAAGTLVQHVYSAGSYRVVLTVMDNQGAAESASIAIAATDQPPEAVLSLNPSSGPVPLTCLMSAAGSSTPVGTLASYQWDFGDGTSGAGPQASHTYSVPGLYFVTLTVMDAANATDSSTVPVFAGEDLNPYTSTFSLNFRKSNSDSFSLSSRNAPVSKTLVTPAGLSGSVQLGGLKYLFKLDAKGAYKAAPLQIKLVPKRAQVTITLTRAALQGGLAASGIQSANAKHQIVQFPFALALKDRVAGSVGLPYDYSARKGVTGSGRLIVNR